MTKTIRKLRQHKIREMNIDAVTREKIAKSGLQPGTRVFQMGECKIFLSQMPSSGDWHMSISTPTRYPEWDEIVYARYELIPNDVTMVMVLPPLEDYINIHAFCFQLHQERREEEGDREEGLGGDLPTALGGQGRYKSGGMN